MEIIKSNINLDFVGKRKLAYSFSGILLLLSILSLVVRGPNYGVDFAGGSIVQVRFAGAVAIDKIRDGLRATGIENVSVQSMGDARDNEFLIRTDTMETGQDFTSKLSRNLEAAAGSGVEVRRLEMVGPQVGNDLKEKALLAILFSLLLTAVYISGRFEFKWYQSAIIAFILGSAVYTLYTFNVPMPYIIPAALAVTLVLFWIFGLKYALGAIVALIHDVTISAGVLSFLGKEFTITVIAALLTIIGYSLNDTIIVYDRIRENVRKLSKTSLGVIINRSVNETLSRTIMTQGLTLVMVVSLYFLGGEIIHDFALALLVGFVVGTYSSIYVASPIVLTWEEHAKKK
ncbi:MAG: protein translocase subunit SecF [Desulfobacterales bacterium]|nr:protein translocase subunit SecF [Desulfobacterales bacterium]